MRSKNKHTVVRYIKPKTKDLKKNEIIGLQINQVNKKYNFWIVLFLNEQ